MMKFWKSYKIKINYRTTNHNFLNKISIKKIIIFQIFNDLAIFRKWKRLKIIKASKVKEFIIMGISPNFSNFKKELEIFFPIALDSSLLKIDCISDPMLFRNFRIPFDIFNFNYALMDKDSSIAYYRISKGLKKTIGPFL